jgi:Tfp pilus assembly protein FimT
VELLVVLVLLGILTAVGAGSMTSLREPDSDAQVQAFRRARAQAIQRGVPVLVRGDSGWTKFFPDGRTVGR